MAFYKWEDQVHGCGGALPPERILRQLWPCAVDTDPPYRPLEAHRGPFTNKYSVKYGFEHDNWERWRNHVLAAEVRGEKAVFEFLATPDYLPWFVKVSHPVITNPVFEDRVMVASTIADNEILENRRALDAALRWMDLPPRCLILTRRGPLDDMVNLLSGRTLSPTPRVHFPRPQPKHNHATTGPTEPGPRHSHHGSTSTPSTQPHLTCRDRRWPPEENAWEGVSKEEREKTQAMINPIMEG
ncbi:hypothetical protein Syun_020594 [Stephania yunnanensis]|uniref:Uncharacterized protein n=1 Tax=Stephania yunnanensis TaxID=152371 RepID=A0AAP0NND1_9MAGN